MEKEFSVGILVSIALIILGYFTIIMSGEVIDTREYYPVTVIFENIEGLSKNDKVRVNGVESGYVENIELVNNKVLVHCKLFNKFTLYENYSILIKNENALAGKYISINPGKAFDEKGNHYAVIQTRENLVGSAIDDPFTLVSQLIQDNRKNINLAILNLKQITEKINRGEGTLGKMINDDTAHEQTTDLIKELRDTIEDTREQAPITSFIRAALTAF